MYKMVSEIFAEIDRANRVEEKIAIMRSCDSPEFRSIFSLAYNPFIQWLIPNVRPDIPLEENIPVGMGYVHFLKALDRVQYLITAPNLPPFNMPQYKRENLYFDIVRSLHPTDAEIWFQMSIDRNFQCRGMNPSLVNMAFPGLLPDGVVETVVENQNPTPVAPSEDLSDELLEDCGEPSVESIMAEVAVEVPVEVPVLVEKVKAEPKQKKQYPPYKVPQRLWEKSTPDATKPNETKPKKKYTYTKEQLLERERKRELKKKKNVEEK